MNITARVAIPMGSNRFHTSRFCGKPAEPATYKTVLMQFTNLFNGDYDFFNNQYGNRLQGKRLKQVKQLMEKYFRETATCYRTYLQRNDQPDALKSYEQAIAAATLPLLRQLREDGTIDWTDDANLQKLAEEAGQNAGSAVEA